MTNYGHFTTMHVQHGGVRGRDLRMARLSRDCRVLFNCPLDLEQVRARARRADASPQALLNLRPAPAGPLPPLHVQVTPYCRDMPAIKYVDLWGGAIRGSLWTHLRRQHLEHWLCKQGQPLWLQAEHLPGATMARLNKCQITAPCRQEVRLTDLLDMEAAFAINAGIGVRPIAGIDGNRYLAEHPLVQRIQNAYAEIPHEPL